MTGHVTGPSPSTILFPALFLLFNSGQPRISPHSLTPEIFIRNPLNLGKIDEVPSKHKNQEVALTGKENAAWQTEDENSFQEM